MKRLIATPEGAGQWSGHHAFRTTLANVTTPATREHEKTEMLAINVGAGRPISYVHAVRADIERYHSGPAPVMADSFRAIY